MTRSNTLFASAGIAALGLTAMAQAQTATLTANLTGSQQNPPVSTNASGTATMVIDLATRAFTLNISFSNLTTGMSVAHIHRAPIGTNGPVIVPLDGPGVVTPFIPAGVTSFTGTLTGIFPAAEFSNLLASNTYINIHSSFAPSGEIRGQLVPAPASLALLGLGGLAAIRRRR